MVVGYALGNRNDVENDILVLGEDQDDVVTFSRSIHVTLSKKTVYSSFQNKQIKNELTVPYSTIKYAKKARAMGIREIVYQAIERPDHNSQVKTLLELWGFESYLDYLYTVCELGFLEGLVPVIDFGFLTPQEIKSLSEVAALIKIPLSSMRDHELVNQKKRFKKQLMYRLKNLEWAGKLNFPSITSILIKSKDSLSMRHELLQEIASIHERYGTIHEVILENYEQEGSKDNPSLQDMLDTVELAKDILPPDISVIVPYYKNKDIKPFLEAGINDLGSIVEYASGRLKPINIDYDYLDETTQGLNLRLQQRFPLRRSFIKEGVYSGKLGQVFDPYKYKLKKEGQEKKEVKV